jgi:hypothetical protein
MKTSSASIQFRESYGKPEGAGSGIDEPKVGLGFKPAG